MSSKKDKFLESAQKFILKGQLDRAIRDYEQVVALDPNDIRHRQRLAELLVRCSRTVEAIGEYESIGKYYADNGFYLKAIAVYKQIQKLDPEDMKTCLNLAVLNEKQGLSGNALAEYGRVYSHLEKNGKPEEALKVLESMIAIDPDNLNTRLKVAENRHKMGMKEESYQDFCQIAVLLKKRGDDSAFRQISDRIRFLFSDRKDVAVEILRALVKGDGADLAIDDLRELIKGDEKNQGAWNLLLEAFHAAGARDDEKKALQNMTILFPDDLSVKERLMRTALDEGDIEGGRKLLTSNSASFMKKGGGEPLERVYRAFLDLAPHDVTLLQGLKELYETVGNRNGAAEILERLDSLSSLEARPAVPPRVEVAAPPVEETPVCEETGVVPEKKGEEEEEIHLTLSEDEVVEVEEAPVEEIPVEEVPVAAEVDATGVGMPPVGVGDGLETGSSGEEIDLEFSGEIDLELEISEHELADLAGEYGGKAEEAETPAELPPPVAEIDLDLETSAGGEGAEEMEPAPFVGEFTLDLGTAAGELPTEEIELSLPSDHLSPTPEISAAEAPGGELEEVSFPSGEFGVAAETSPGGLFTEEEMESVEIDLGILPETAGEEAVFPSGQDKYGTEGQFSAFKKGLAQQLDQGDTETRYSLGIAFMEMGLYDEAIAEFAAASADPRRRLDCISLQGVCFRDKGDFDSAEEIFKKGIGLAGLSVEETLSIKYELALLYESTGRKEDALLMYGQIRDEKHDFRDTMKKIALLEGRSELSDEDLVELDGEEVD